MSQNSIPSVSTQHGLSPHASSPRLAKPFTNSPQTNRVNNRSFNTPLSPLSQRVSETHSESISQLQNSLGALVRAGSMALHSRTTLAKASRGKVDGIEDNDYSDSIDSLEDELVDDDASPFQPTHQSNPDLDEDEDYFVSNDGEALEEFAEELLEDDKQMRRRGSFADTVSAFVRRASGIFEGKVLDKIATPPSEHANVGRKLSVTEALPVVVNTPAEKEASPVSETTETVWDSDSLADYTREWLQLLTSTTDSESHCSETATHLLHQCTSMAPEMALQWTQLILSSNDLVVLMSVCHQQILLPTSSAHRLSLCRLIYALHRHTLRQDRLYPFVMNFVPSLMAALTLNRPRIETPKVLFDEKGNFLSVQVHTSPSLKVECTVEERTAMEACLLLISQRTLSARASAAVQCPNGATPSIYAKQLPPIEANCNRFPYNVVREDLFTHISSTAPMDALGDTEEAQQKHFYRLDTRSWPRVSQRLVRRFGDCLTYVAGASLFVFVLYLGRQAAATETQLKHVISQQWQCALEAIPDAPSTSTLIRILNLFDTLQGVERQEHKCLFVAARARSVRWTTRAFLDMIDALTYLRYPSQAVPVYARLAQVALEALRERAFLEGTPELMLATDFIENEDEI